MCRLPSTPEAPKVLVPAPSSVLIIFDWDDTLFPTSALAELGYDLSGPAPEAGSRLAEVLSEHARETWATLELASQFGTPMIITAAEEGWVQQTCAKYMPSVLAALHGPDSWVRVVSARSTYEPLGFEGSFEWKKRAFAAAARRHYGKALGCKRHIVSIGDAEYERMAVQATAAELGLLSKSLKLLTAPSFARITEESGLMRQTLDHLVNHHDELDLQMEPEW
mmetsp:Transcript_87073/g.198742  ORF Transcript_87073/g.198742 Transcript_87073/m.198742 type:complete len:223 (+) Transcript_87073:115-783(+)